MDFDGSSKLCLVVPLVCFRDGLFVAAVVRGKLRRLSIASFNTCFAGALVDEYTRPAGLCPDGIARNDKYTHILASLSLLARYLFATNATRLAIMSDLGIIVRGIPPAAV